MGLPRETLEARGWKAASSRNFIDAFHFMEEVRGARGARNDVIMGIKGSPGY